jgi:hypothetical protein
MRRPPNVDKKIRIIILLCTFPGEGKNAARDGSWTQAIEFTLNIDGFTWLNILFFHHPRLRMADGSKTASVIWHTSNWSDQRFLALPFRHGSSTKYFYSGLFFTKMGRVVPGWKRLIWTSEINWKQCIFISIRKGLLLDDADRRRRPYAADGFLIGWISVHGARSSWHFFLVKPTLQPDPAWKEETSWSS